MVSDRPVGRTFYLPPELAEKLRVHAFRNNRTQNDVMVEAVRVALAEPLAPEEHPCNWACMAGCTSPMHGGYGDPNCADEQARKAGR
ncbi:hypothetical protein KABACHOK_01290 [Brevundimonas phage vB_BpoS-Kabachok]|uniref:Uncharacterized protein n=1 Tax=Brevundimonas phage vB_BpoS-Kabachok TaxID=2948600 RepID=A0A9E7MP39_9CAUD|nr:hypothetical protein KABACHOK_01290 [Brevundimonas phage vB_BpoS-Kabachok]